METSFHTTHPLLHYGVLAFIYAVALLTLFSHTIAHALDGHTHRAVIGQAVTCPSVPRRTDTLTFTPHGIEPSTVTVDTCDMVTIINKSGQEIVAAMGPHSHHIDYPGFVETPLKDGQAYTFRATESGQFPVHDHDNDTLTGTLIVK